MGVKGHEVRPRLHARAARVEVEKYSRRRVPGVRMSSRFTRWCGRPNNGNVWSSLVLMGRFCFGHQKVCCSQGDYLCLQLRGMWGPKGWVSTGCTCPRRQLLARRYLTRKASSDDVKMVHLSYRVRQLREHGDTPSDVLRFLLLVDIYATMSRTPCTEEGLRNVLVEVYSEVYTVIFGSITPASFASSSRVLGPSNVDGRVLGCTSRTSISVGSLFPGIGMASLVFTARREFTQEPFFSVVQAYGVAGSNAVYGEPIPRARKCQHITEHARG